MSENIEPQVESWIKNLAKAHVARRQKVDELHKSGEKLKYITKREKAELIDARNSANRSRKRLQRRERLRETQNLPNVRPKTLEKEAEQRQKAARRLQEESSDSDGEKVKIVKKPRGRPCKFPKPEPVVIQERVPTPEPSESSKSSTSESETSDKSSSESEAPVPVPVKVKNRHKQIEKKPIPDTPLIPKHSITQRIFSMF